ncbi:helix-turn-helix transcriptional regulator [Streptomyces sp. NPDC046909]|uniref:helix-turn-helix domain-containing protein n=1 Tax=Streptomyces sp. NPDC046909 TaxID=3155617 RepID=UPI0033F210D9
MAGDEFSELLGQLKERSGLSYGVLGKRLHTSTSTLHRYVNGDAVPTDYAPVERFARLCKASPEELVELHRRWVLADARRGQKAAAPITADDESEATPEIEPQPEPSPEATPAPAPEAPRPRRRTVVLAGVAVAAALVSAALVANLVPGKGTDDAGGQRTVGAGAPSVGASPGVSKSAASKSASPSGSPSGSPTSSPSASRSRTAGTGKGGSAVADGATAPAVDVNPYKWADPCGPHILIDREPEQVPPPPNEPDARGWNAALGGVTGGEQMVALTVQGTGKATVVLEDLHVRIVEKSAPLTWNDYRMHDGCGGGVDTTAFDVNLDDGRPLVSPRSGQRGFPYKVTESDPEVFYIFADVRSYNVSWYLELEWSSGDRHGILRLDDHGNPFRTSGNVGRPAYIHPNGSSAWERNEYEPEVPG